jgi:hypothetical protein
MSGNSRIDMPDTDIKPMMTNINEMTAAKTGRRTEMSDISKGLP